MLNRIILWSNIVAIYIAISSTHVFIAWGSIELVMIVIVFELVRLLAIQTYSKIGVIALATVSICFISFNYYNYYNSKVKYSDLSSNLIQEAYIEHLNNTKNWFKDKTNLLSIKSVNEVTQVMKETSDKIEEERKNNSQKKPVSPWVVFLIMCVSELVYARIIYTLSLKKVVSEDNKTKENRENTLQEVIPPLDNDLKWGGFVNSSKVVNFKGKWYSNNKEVLDIYGK